MILDEKNVGELGYTFEKAGVWRDVFISCDYCGAEFKRCKRSILNGRKIIQKDCCSMCIEIKKKESNTVKHGSNYKRKHTDKSKAAIIAKYGVPINELSKQQEIKDKIKNTCLEKYDATCFLKTDKIKQYREENALINYKKMRTTLLKEVGVVNISQTDFWKEKVKETNMEKYGAVNAMQNDQIKDRCQKSLELKYGVKHALQNKDCLNKAKQTCVKLYGVENYSQTDEYREKYEATCIKRYGVANPSQNNEIFKKIIATKIAKYGHPWPTNFGKTEQDIKDWLLSNNLIFVKDYNICNGKEIDLFNATYKLAIEYCGLYWHNEYSPEPRTRSYHFNKYRSCKDKDIRLITIFEDEWRCKNKQCKDVILSALGIFDEKIMARKCQIKELKKEEFYIFCEANHTLGKTHFKVAFGLFYNNTLIGAMSLGKHHRENNGNRIILNRLCFKIGIQVIGGASKLLKHCLSWCNKNNYNTIISWSDNRWSVGKIYEKLGFVLDKELPPDYSYVNNSKHIRINKQSCKKKNIKCPTNKTEKEWLLNNGFARIWDCGKKRWLYRIP